MEKATEKFENYIDFWVKFKPCVADKIMFCIYKGMDSPQGLLRKLEIAKGNLANYCKKLVKDRLILQHTYGRSVIYRLTEKGQAYVIKFLEAINVSL